MTVELSAESVPGLEHMGPQLVLTSDGLRYSCEDARSAIRWLTDLTELAEESHIYRVRIVQ